MNTKVPPSDANRIVERLTNGETLQQVADTYDVTRERIRQIAHDAGYDKNAQQREAVRAAIPDIINRRWSWESNASIFKNYPFSIHVFESVMAEQPLILQRAWDLAKEQPRATPNQNPLGRRCVRCFKYKPWDQFPYSTVNATGRGQSCHPCNRAGARAQYQRNKEAPRQRITDKRCPGCGAVKPPSAFYRSVGTKDGLQQYCKECCRVWARGERPRLTQEKPRKHRHI